MKRARVMCESICIICECGEAIPHPENGSEFWTVWEIPRKRFSLKCRCGEICKVDIPKRAELMNQPD